MREEEFKINIRLKKKSEEFTIELFYLLFEDESRYLKQCNVVRDLFLEMASNFLIADEITIWNKFVKELGTIKSKLLADAKTIEANDPASKSVEEVVLAYPGFYAIAIYRLSHQLHLLGIPILPRMMSENAHSTTGTDIHPGAQIGDNFFIDHATGTVIGETVIIKNNVKIYQGVTLGAFHIKKSMSFQKRHPTIEDNVIIYANATILGGETNIGKNSTIGANVWITKSIPENSFVHHNSETIIKTKKA